MPEIALEQISKHYPGGVKAVEGMTLTVRDGELLVLVGPSGCGKTTTLRLIAGLETPSRGVLRIGGRDARDLPPRSRDVALVFQRPAVYPHLTVRQNLAFGLEIRRGGGPLRRVLSWLWQAPEIEERVHEVAGLLSLGEVLNRHAHQLSGGQQQRVALGRALVRRPSVLLLDEPLAGLDAPLRLELRRELHLLHRRFPATIIYVTHDPLEAMSLGDRVVVLDRGAVQQTGTPEEVYRRPVNRFVAGFFRRAPVNFFDGRLVLDSGRLAFDTADWLLPVPAGIADRWESLEGRDLTLGLRAEDVEVLPSRLRLSTGDDLEAHAALVEPLGQGWLVSFTAPRRTGPELITYFGCQRPGPRDKIEEGRQVRVRLHLDRAHLFDRATGVALGNESGAH
jgi:multiple sugar transport system ATP-binding protein